MTSPAAAPSLQLLQRVGRAVRHYRSRQGLTRAALAARSGLSSRFLAQIEAGTGNVSLLRLDGVARALDVPLLRLVSAPDGPAPLRVALLGLRGAGKSTIGARLAGRLGMAFVELDTRIEEAAGLPVGQIFELHGERYFRRLERETLARLLGEGPACVIATGGGLVTDAESFALLREACFTVWLSARPEDHYDRVLAQGDRRPMQGNPEAMSELRALLAARRPLYRLADLSVDTSVTSADAAAGRILGALGIPEQPA